MPELDVPRVRDNKDPWPDNKIGENSHAVDIRYSEKYPHELMIEDLYARLRYHRMMELKLSRQWHNRKAVVERQNFGQDAIYIRMAKDDDTAMKDFLAGQKWHTEEAASLAAHLLVELKMREMALANQIAHPAALLADKTVEW
jgi:hypothetical protein